MYNIQLLCCFEKPTAKNAYLHKSRLRHGFKVVFINEKVNFLLSSDRI